jgi:hypothetical protein
VGTNKVTGAGSAGTQDEDFFWIDNLCAVCRLSRAAARFSWRGAIGDSDTHAAPWAAGTAHARWHALADSHENPATHNDHLLRKLAIGPTGSRGSPSPPSAGRKLASRVATVDAIRYPASGC